MEPIVDTPRPAPRSAAWIAFRVLAVAGILSALLLVIGTAHLSREGVASMLSAVERDTTAVDTVALRTDLTRLKRRIEAKQPKGAYLVVSSSDNQFRLMKGADTLRAGLCSTGSYVHLTAGDGRNWLFATPRGTFRIQEKRVKPVWSKPDWAFIEAGQPVPPPGSAERFERGVLGEYALSIGNGYLIHGTPYQRLLGLPVSHGCVRLGKDDLEEVYKTLAVGSPVFLY